METNPPKKRVLIVEDDVLLQSLLRRVLEKSDIEVSIADDGVKALDSYAQTDHLDLILLDLNLPELNGIEVAKKIRKIENQTPIIGMTGYTSETVIEDCLEAGMNGCYLKPIAKSTLTGIIKTYLT